MGNTTTNSEEIIIQAKEDLFKILPLIPLFMTILGGAKIHYYYRPYKINIFNYLDFQDILLLFTNDFYNIIISFSIIVAINFIGFERQPVIQQPQFATPDWFTKLPLSVQGVFVVLYRVLTSTIAITFICVLLITYFDIYKYPALTISLAVAIATLLRSRIYVFFLKNLNDKIAYLYTFYVSFFLLLILITFISEIIDRDKRKNEYSNGGYIKTEKEVINFDKNKKLIGRTKSYSFIFTPSDSCVQVISNSDIKDFFIKATH